MQENDFKQRHDSNCITLHGLKKECDDARFHLNDKSRSNNEMQMEIAAIREQISRREAEIGAFHRDLENSFENHGTHLVLRLASAALDVRNFVLNTYFAARSHIIVYLHCKLAHWFGGTYQLFGMAHPTPELAAASWDRVLEAMPDLVANNQPHAKAFATEPLKGELEVWKTCN